MQIGQKFSIAIHILLSCEFFKDEKNTSEFLAGTVGTKHNQAFKIGEFNKRKCGHGWGEPG